MPVKNCFLAPMAEFTSPPMRLLCEESGAVATYTEMVCADGIIRHGRKTLNLLEIFPEEKNVFAHIYGFNPETVAEAAGYVDSLHRFKGIDINAGCPVPRITSQGSGSALIKDLPRLQEIVKATVNAVKSPVSVKTRLGPHPADVKIFELLERIQDAGASSLTLHARFTSQGHGGTVHLDLLKAVKEKAKIPVYGNGSVVDFNSWSEMVRTGVDGVAIARAALGNPQIFQSVYEPNPIKPTIEAICTQILRHFELELRYRRLVALPDAKLSPEDLAVITFKTHLFRYFKGFAGSSTLRAGLMNYKTPADCIAAIAAMQSAGR